MATGMTGVSVAEAHRTLVIDRLSKSYVGRRTESQAIGEITFDVCDREFVTVVGPSGCGKTTLLKCIAGLIHPSSGRTAFAGTTVTAPMPAMALVFQDYSRSLFPWLTVRKNVLLPLKAGSKAEHQELVSESLRAVGLSEYENHYPWQLSGGMQQRVAIARALASRPRLLLMDEPFASVDAQTRADLEDLVLRIHGEFEVTTLLVTHDIDEAVYMSDRVVILSNHPSFVQEVLTVDIPRPRSQEITKATREFAQLRTHVYRAITRAHGGEQHALNEGTPSGAQPVELQKEVARHS